MSYEFLGIPYKILWISYKFLLVGIPYRFLRIQQENGPKKRPLKKKGTCGSAVDPSLEHCTLASKGALESRSPFEVHVRPIKIHNYLRTNKAFHWKYATFTQSGPLTKRKAQMARG